MKALLAQRSAFIQCAGHACEERDDCLRYCKRGGDVWASFDVERQAQGGDCPFFKPTQGKSA